MHLEDHIIILEDKKNCWTMVNKMSFHDETDKLSQLIKDVRDSENAQHTTPYSVRQSAVLELKDRGYTDSQIENLRLYGKLESE